MRSEKEIRKIICPKCNVETNHKQVWNSGNLGWTDEDSGMWEKTEYRLFQCMGCETPTLSKTDIFSEDLEENVKLWPNRPNSGISTRAIKIIYDAPPVVKRIYRETIEAFNLELTTLCAAGIRVIIEAICREENADGKDLKEKIDSLKNKGIISEKLCEGLQTSRLVGNSSLHELKLFGTSELSFGLDLIESLLDYHYNTETRSSILKNKLSPE